jgi:CDP-glycerol glycerophosphotransferase
MIDKRTILFYAGNFNKNMVTRLFLNLVNSIDLNKYDIAICVDMNAINKSAEREEEFMKLNSHIEIISRTGRMLMSIEEKNIYKKFESEKYFETQEMERCYTEVYEKEYRRIFNNRYFDAIVHFEGYNLFWQRLFAYAPSSMVSIKSIFQHYNMDKIWKEKYPTLEFNFKLYKEFNHIISTSKELSEVNKKNIAIAFDVPPDSFTYIEKIHNHKDILEKARASLSKKNLFLNTKVFINIARLSKENNQEKIIRAFSKISRIDSSTRLVYLGTGVLEQSLRDLIKELYLVGRVFLLGQRYNPSSYLQQANCLVCASETLEESILLKEVYFMKKPIIVTDTEVHRAILKNDEGVFVDDCEDGLYEGMRKFLDENSEEHKIFNYFNYNQNILETFYKKIFEDSF